MNKKTKVAFQGEKGAYSHLACLEVFPETDVICCSTFEEAFQLAKDNSEYKIIIPIENSLAGRVADIHYLIPKYKLQIHAEHFQKVSHNLLGIKGAKLKDVKTVRSHAQAIGQCRKIINENNFKTIISADTAGSAKYISESKDITKGAIASTLSSEIYNLKIIDSNIQDEKENVTRFLLMGKEVFEPEFNNEKFITSFLFKLKSKPAALYSALSGFAINGVNLTKLQSFPEKNSFSSYFFLCELDGHIQDNKIKSSLEDLNYHCEDMHVLGVFKADQFRSK